MGHIGDAPGYEIEKAWMDRVAEVVGKQKMPELMLLSIFIMMELIVNTGLALKMLLRMKLKIPQLKQN